MTEAPTSRMDDHANPTQLQTSLDDFLYAAVHDIRGPLGQVRVLVMLLERQHRNSLDAEGQELCGLIDAASQRAVEVVESIHSYALASEAPIPESADMNAIFDAALFTLQADIDRNLASITRGDLGFIRGDRTKLLLLFQELFRNAMKFRMEAPPRVHCCVTSMGNSEARVLFSLVDNGIGIAEKDAEAIFRPLKRLHGRDFAGVGMGLAICRRIVEAHGGEIWENANPKGGSNFQFTLPSPPA